MSAQPRSSKGASGRRRLVGVLIVLYLLWPLVQQQLVRVARVDPWKFAGWAMYTAPSARVRVQLLGVDGNERSVRLHPAMSPAIKNAVEEFALKRRTLGLFVEPETIADSLLATLPAYHEWTVVVEQVGLTPQNYFGVIHRSEYRYANVAGQVGAVGVRHGDGTGPTR